MIYLILIIIIAILVGIIITNPLIRWLWIIKQNARDNYRRELESMLRTNIKDYNNELLKIQSIIERLTFNVLGVNFSINAYRDKLATVNQVGRIYLQLSYFAPCTKTGEMKEWTGRKWYLSQFMTEDEVIKTAYCAAKATVEHEIMEGFKVDNIILFNPHINYEELLAISHKEITRENNE